MRAAFCSVFFTSSRAPSAPFVHAATRRVFLVTALALPLCCACSANDPMVQSTDPAEEEDDDEVEVEQDDDENSDPVRDAGAQATPPKNADGEEQDDDDSDDEPTVRGADGASAEPNECAAIKRDAPGKGGVDIIFLIDTSGSMLHATTQVIENLDSFVQGFESTEADARVVMITGDDPAVGSPVADADNYRFIRSEVDSRALFNVALSRFSEYGSFLRPNAVTQFVMVTDDNDELASADFQRRMEDLLGHEFTQHAIASEDVGGLPCISEAQMWDPLCIAPIPAICGAMAIGERYYTLADDTGGKKLSVCKADWNPVFGELTAAIVAAVPLPCDYSLADASNEEFDPEQVTIVYTADGATEDEPFPKALTPDRCTDKIGWFYDDNAKPSRISLCPTACERVQEGGKINIAFGCEPQIFL